MPRWALTLDSDERSLLLRHEMEHLRAHDAPLVALTGVALILAPWNVPLWWLWRRLRAAVELDCDARVLSAHNDAGNYGTLLLTVAGRRASRGMTVVPALAFAESRTDLERRILAMSQQRPSRPVVRAVSALAIAATVIVIACEAPRPTAPLAPKAEYSWSASGLQAEKSLAPATTDSVRVGVMKALVRSVIQERFPRSREARRRTNGYDRAGRDGYRRRHLAHVRLVVHDAHEADGTSSAPVRRERHRCYSSFVFERHRTPMEEPPAVCRAAGRVELCATHRSRGHGSVEVLKLKAGDIAPQPVDAILVTLSRGDVQARAEPR